MVTHGTLDIDPFRSKCTASSRAAPITATTARQSISHWWPASAPPATSPRLVWARASCMRFCGAAIAVRPRAWCASRVRRSARAARWRAIWTCGSTRAWSTAGCWTRSTTKARGSWAASRTTPVLDAYGGSPTSSVRPAGRLQEGDEFAVELGLYQAERRVGARPYRVVLVVIDLPDPKTGLRDLFPHYFFLVTNWSVAQRSGWELAGALPPAWYVRGSPGRVQRRDRQRPVSGCVRRQRGQSCYAEVAGVQTWTGMLRGELEDASGCGWDLKRVQQTVLKAGARVVEHSRRLIVDVARAAGVLWHRLLDRVRRWWRPNGADGSAVWGGASPRPRRWVPPPRHSHLSLVLRE